VPVDVDAVVVANDRLSPDYNVLRVAAPDVAVDSRPGQFVMVKQSLDAEPLLRRPFSIFEVLRDPSGTVTGLSLLNKTVGLVTRALHMLEPGQRLRCLGPLGKPFSIPSVRGEAWMVAGGVGLAPFLRLAEAFTTNGTPTTLFYGGRSSHDLYYVERFVELGARIVLATEDGSQGVQGFVTAPLGDALAATSPDTVVTLYACGPTAMMQAVASLAREHGRAVEVSLEPVMGCGMGGCYSCVVPVRREEGHTRFVRACVDGPVFGGDAVAWSELARWAATHP